MTNIFTPKRTDASLKALAVGTVFSLSIAFAVPAIAHPPAEESKAETPKAEHAHGGKVVPTKMKGGPAHSEKVKDADASKAAGHHGAKAAGAAKPAGHHGAKASVDAGQQAAGHHGAGAASDGASAGHHGGAPTFTFGHPSPDATPDRTVHIDALDSMSYNPPSITVKPGSVIKFMVTNKGEIPHAWSIDTVKEQIEHETGMAGMEMDDMMGHMKGSPNGFVLDVGETKSLVWTFTTGADIQYACHLPGHYEAGMRGELTISGGTEEAKPEAH